MVAHIKIGDRTYFLHSLVFVWVERMPDKVNLSSNPYDVPWVLHLYTGGGEYTHIPTTDQAETELNNVTTVLTCADVPLVEVGFTFASHYHADSGRTERGFINPSQIEVIHRGVYSAGFDYIGFSRNVKGWEGGVYITPSVELLQRLGLS